MHLADFEGTFTSYIFHTFIKLGEHALKIAHDMEDAKRALH